MNLVVPAFSSGVNHVECGLGRDKAKCSGCSGNGTPSQVRSTILNTNNVNQKVLVRKVGRISAHKKSGGTTNSGRKTLVVEAVLVGGFFNVFEEAAQNGSASPEAKVEGRSATNPGSGKDLHEAQVGSLESVDEWLPRGSAAKCSASEEEAGLKFLLHVDTTVNDLLLDSVVGVVAKEHTKCVAESSGESESHGIRSVAEFGLGNDAGCLPAKAGREDFADSDFSSDDETIGNSDTLLLCRACFDPHSDRQGIC